MAKLTSVYYAVATDPNTGSSVSIMSEKPLMDFSEEYYINQVKTQLGTMESIKYEIGETAKEIVGDKEYSTLTVTTTMSGINFIQKYYVHKMDEYFVCLILTSTNGESVIDLPAGTEMVMPGDNVAMTIELITPIAIEKGLRFAIREGGRTVGSGIVSDIIE